MENSITPEQSIMLAVATLYIALTEAVQETLEEVNGTGG